MSEPPANSPSKSTNRPLLCLHAWIVIERIARAEISELDAVAHTSLVAIGCLNCRLALVYPIENAALVTPRYFEALRLNLAARNWNLPADLRHYAP
jgi:hypothetical protein